MISEIEVGKTTKPIWHLAKHTAERAAIARAPYTTKRNRSTRKTTKAAPEKDDTVENVYRY